MAVIDWESVEREYRIGVRSLRDIGAEFGVSEGAIRKKAKAEDWARDLSAKIAAKAEALVRKQEVREKVRSDRAPSEVEVVSVYAQSQADIQISQKSDVSQSRAVIQRQLAELAAILDSTEELDRLGEMMTDPDSTGADRLNEIYRKVISLPGRVDTTKKLTEALRIAVELERKVWRIKDDEPDSGDGGLSIEVKFV